MKDGTKIDYKEEVHGKAYKELMANPNMGKDKLGTQALAAGNDLEAQVAILQRQVADFGVDDDSELKKQLVKITEMMGKSKSINVISAATSG